MKVKMLLRKVREEKGYSLEELSKMTGISKGHLSKIERNETMPTITTLVMIAKALHVNMENLYEIVK